MEVLYRRAGGKDPLGDVELTATPNAKTPEEAIYKGWDFARRFNKGQRRDGKHAVVTVQCGDLLLDVASGKLRSLSGPAPAPIIAQPNLSIPDKKQPSLF